MPWPGPPQITQCRSFPALQESKKKRPHMLSVAGGDLAGHAVQDREAPSNELHAFPSTDLHRTSLSPSMMVDTNLA